MCSLYVHVLQFVCLLLVQCVRAFVVTIFSIPSFSPLVKQVETRKQKDITLQARLCFILKHLRSIIEFFHWVSISTIFIFTRLVKPS